MKVNIIKSETWFGQSDSMQETLQETIDEFVDSDEVIINIQLVESNSLSLFLIYTTKRAAFPTADQVILPRKLTAENGAKAMLIGEFFETIERDCPECDEYGECTDDCESCGGTGSVIEKVTVSWTTIKAIHDKIVETLEFKP